MHFPNMAVGAEMDLQQSIRRMKTQRKEDQQSREVLTRRIKYLHESCPHTSSVNLRKLVWYITKLGFDETCELAKNHLTKFLFVQQCEKKLEKMR